MNFCEIVVQRPEPARPRISWNPGFEKPAHGIVLQILDKRPAPHRAAKRPAGGQGWVETGSFPTCLDQRIDQARLSFGVKTTPDSFGDFWEQGSAVNRDPVFTIGRPTRRLWLERAPGRADSASSTGAPRKS